MDIVHFHRPKPGPREWLCGAINGHASGVPAAVTCPECLEMLAKEQQEPDGDKKAIPVHEPELPG